MFGLCCKLLNIIKFIYTSVQTCLILNTKLADFFDVTIGLKQGEPNYHPCFLLAHQSRSISIKGECSGVHRPSSGVNNRLLWNYKAALLQIWSVASLRQSHLNLPICHSNLPHLGVSRAKYIITFKHLL
jgi:hypothetical protein